MASRDEIDALCALLPQTQCRQCGCDGCANYAKAILENKAPINRCAPGGARGIEKLASYLKRSSLPLDPEYGTEKPFARARIDPAACIGCRLCADACPVDAISGVPKHLFSVIKENCTGCALCVSACPMDCISMIEEDHLWNEADAKRAKDAYEKAQTRKKLLKNQLKENYEQLANNKKEVLTNVLALVRKQK